jgi:hypothetical protein
MPPNLRYVHAARRHQSLARPTDRVDSEEGCWSRVGDSSNLHHYRKASRRGVHLHPITAPVFYRAR